MEELESSLEIYEQQLSQVKQALEADKNNQDLVKLNADLQQLIALTTQNILEEKKKLLLAQVQEIERDREIEPEPLPKVPEEKSAEGPDRRQEQETDEPLDLSQLDGMKCKAPYRSRASLGSSSMHNAMIFQTEPGAANAVSLDHVLVRVVFSHPTSTGMVPCPFYMDGKCRFSDSDCKFSHGEHAVAFMLMFNDVRCPFQRGNWQKLILVFMQGRWPDFPNWASLKNPIMTV